MRRRLRSWSWVTAAAVLLVIVLAGAGYGTASWAALVERIRQLVSPQTVTSDGQLHHSGDVGNCHKRANVDPPRSRPGVEVRHTPTAEERVVVVPPIDEPRSGRRAKPPPPR